MFCLLPDLPGRLFYTSVGWWLWKLLICSFKYYHNFYYNYNMEESQKNQVIQTKGKHIEPFPIKTANTSNDDGYWGINRRLYKKNEKADDVQIKLPPDITLLPNSPQFLNLPEAYQRIATPRVDILEDMLRREIQQLMFADTLMNQIVYDSKEVSPYHADLQQSGLNLDVYPYYIPKSKNDKTLIFESRFESGNLRRAIQIGDYDYQLILEADYQTTGHTQWFYFSVANTRKDIQYRFKILNMNKLDSLYNSGMKPLVYSQSNARNKKMGWHRSGNNICYYNGSLKRKNGGYLFALTFTMKFDNDCDTVYIAHCYPYTYTQLCRYLKSLDHDPNKKGKFQRKTLCLSEAGNPCDYLVIGEYGANLKDKKAVVITSRVHPGETMVSQIIQYIIDFLLGNSMLAKILRDNFVFKIVPMLNIDGVIIGNYRCNLTGADLNRQWLEPSRKLYPTIYNTKLLMKKTKQERQLVLYVDLHGHSRKKNAFMYGCTGKQMDQRQKVFPMIMKNNSQIFSFKQCSFVVQKNRQGTARIALWKQFGIMNCLTFQLSFCGSDFGNYNYYHFNNVIYREIAQSFCQTIMDYYEPEQVKFKQAFEQVQNYYKNNKQAEQKGDSDDSDYSSSDEEKQPQGNQASKEQKKSSTEKPSNFPDQSNKMIIKKKIIANIPLKKKDKK